MLRLATIISKKRLLSKPRPRGGDKRPHRVFYRLIKFYYLANARL